MADISDEILMAYADGELSDTDTAALASYIAADPALQARLAIFTRTGHRLAVPFDEIDFEAVPPAMIAAVRRMPAGVQSQAPPRGATTAGGLNGLFDRISQALSPAPRGWALATAAVAVAAVTGALIVALPSQQDAQGGRDLAVLGRAVGPAPTVLARLLDSLQSGQISQIEADAGRVGVTVATRLTFFTKEGGICRLYEVAGAGPDGRGLACRVGPGWQVVAVSHGAAPVAAQGVPGENGRQRPAAPPSPGDEVEQAITARIDGDAVDTETEQRLIANNWKRGTAN